MQNINRNRTMQILITIFHMQTLLFICKKWCPQHTMWEDPQCPNFFLKLGFKSNRLKETLLLTEHHFFQSVSCAGEQGSKPVWQDQTWQGETEAVSVRSGTSTKKELSFFLFRLFVIDICLAKCSAVSGCRRASASKLKPWGRRWRRAQWEIKSSWLRTSSQSCASWLTRWNLQHVSAIYIQYLLCLLVSLWSFRVDVMMMMWAFFLSAASTQRSWCFHMDDKQREAHRLCTRSLQRPPLFHHRGGEREGLRQSQDNLSQGELTLNIVNLFFNSAAFVIVLSFPSRNKDPW